MDLSSLKEQVSNLTLYDLKAGVRKVQNGTLNWGIQRASPANCLA
jgi:epsin